MSDGAAEGAAIAMLLIQSAGRLSGTDAMIRRRQDTELPRSAHKALLDVTSISNRRSAVISRSSSTTSAGEDDAEPVLTDLVDSRVTASA